MEQFIKTVRHLLKDELYEDAQRMCHELIARDPENYVCRRYLGESYLRSGWHYVDIVRRDLVKQMAVLAAKEMKRVVELNERYADGHYLLAEAWCMKLSLGNPIDVVKLGHKVGEEYGKALALDPRNADAYVSWAAYGKLNAPLSYGGGPDAAMETLAGALEIEPNHLEGNVWMGVCYLSKNDPQKAREHWEKVLLADPDHRRAKSLLASL